MRIHHRDTIEPPSPKPVQPTGQRQTAPWGIEYQGPEWRHAWIPHVPPSVDETTPVFLRWTLRSHSCVKGSYKEALQLLPSEAAMEMVRCWGWEEPGGFQDMARGEALRGSSETTIANIRG